MDHITYILLRFQPFHIRTSIQTDCFPPLSSRLERICQPSERKQNILNLLNKCKETDKNFKQFASKSHKYKLNPPINKNKVIEVLKLLGMLEYKDRMIYKLSGGQVQRVFLARTLISNPDLIILDEPTNGIDQETIDLIYKILQDLNKNKNISIVMVTHDVERMAKISNRVFCFEEGTLIELAKNQIDIELSHKHKHPHNNVCSC